MLTGLNAEEDIIASLEAGANDYVVKPMRMGELLARVKSQLWQHKASDTARFLIGGLSFIPVNKLLKSADETRKVILTEKDRQSSNIFTGHCPTASRRRNFLPRSGASRTVSAHTVETHIYRLRQKVKQLTTNNVIVTTTQGYSLGRSMTAPLRNQNMGMSRGWLGR